jgi:hypothetical protein
MTKVELRNYFEKELELAVSIHEKADILAEYTEAYIGMYIPQHLQEAFAERLLIILRKEFDI